MAHALTRAEAAARRGMNVRQRTDRPQKRSSPGGGRAYGRAVDFRLAAEPGESGVVNLSGLASATGASNGYEMYDYFGEYIEVVETGAFANTLNRVDLDCPLVIGHDQIRRIAITTNGTLRLAETAEGLDVNADVDLEDDDAEYIVRKIRSGLIREMSFAFRIVRGVWSPDWMQYTITEVDMHRGDVAIVGYGANPNTVIGVGGETLDAGETGGCDCPDCPGCGEEPMCPDCPGGCQCACGGSKKNAASQLSERDRSLALLNLALMR